MSVSLDEEKDVPSLLFHSFYLLVTSSSLFATVTHVSVARIRTYRRVRATPNARRPLNFSRRACGQDCEITQSAILFHVTSSD